MLSDLERRIRLLHAELLEGRITSSGFLDIFESLAAEDLAEALSVLRAIQIESDQSFAVPSRASGRVRDAANRA